VGGAFGVVVGLGVAMLVAAVSPMPAAVSPFWAGVGVLLGMSVGIIAGVYPAWQASKLDPVDALRYE
jgi:putative ABC transport system permease protein